MTGLAFRHLHHHGRFYIALALAAAAYFLCRGLAAPLPFAVTGDVFFLSYILMMGAMIAMSSHKDLRAHAAIDDEGAGIVVLIALAAIGYSCIEIFTVLNQKNRQDVVPTVLAVIGAPLGWLMFHMMASFHYAYLFYRRSEKGEPQDPPPLAFPKTREPGPWDFLYYALVVGMTAQTSDVEVQTTQMRKATTLHAAVSFFFNTVLIAMSVNAVVARAS